ncbi:MAG: MMPL family transporter [Candidatus Pelagibacter bacterium]|nr:MMPL family transporter [Candidatus Pelagibacter bacterium]
MLAHFYQKNLIEKPKVIFILLVFCLITFGYYSKDFKLDASSDTLLLENDPDLKYLREITKRYGANEFLVLTYSPNEEIISKNSIKNLINLKEEIQSLDWVENVITILDVPLLDSTDESLAERIKNFKTLKDETIDRERGFNEILNSPVFRNFLISKDGSTSGIIVYVKRDKKLIELQKTGGKELQDYKEYLKNKNHLNILEIRKIISIHQSSAEIFLGGIPMIADDMISFIKNDIVVFGIGVFSFIVLTLWFVFRKFIWILIPISSCFFSVLIMMGLLGLIGWKVTVISSNFIALMLILTMAMNIHLSTRFLQLKKEFPLKKNTELIYLATSKMFWPIIYTALTTICAFLSLIVSEIKPIIDFGWMMTLGLITSFVITFTLLPTLLNLFPNNKINIKQQKNSIITKFLEQISLNNKNQIFIITIIIIGLSIFGINKLEVENSFINYFDKETEIYKGMKLIDEKLGGTTPLEVIIKFPANNKNESKENTDDEDFEDWDEEGDSNKEKYWFTKDKVDKIKLVHDYLDSLPAVGKVISFSSILEMAKKLNDNKDLDTLEIGVLYSKLPETIKNQIVNPYISIDDNEARINLRIKDSLKDLRRNELIKKINFDLENKLNLKKEEFKLAGVLILFNNLLQSLFKSQILTLGFVMIGILAMFIVLFRNIKLSLIGVVPNFIAAFFILGIIGILEIPLDMMTITIAAITIGIAVDNSIHYIYRFKEEFNNIKDYKKTLKKCHSTVGIAILNTSITIVFGFSILVLSNFIPTIYFGVFTGLAMLLAMVSVLTLLPALIISVKPFKLK